VHVSRVGGDGRTVAVVSWYFFLMFGSSLMQPFQLSSTSLSCSGQAKGWVHLSVRGR
jgi:hypothetical protein